MIQPKKKSTSSLGLAPIKNKWLIIYLGIVLLNITTMYHAVKQNQQFLDLNAEVIRSNRNNNNALQALSAVLVSIQKVNAPANNVFNSKDPIRENENLKTEQNHFKSNVVKLNHLLDELQTDPQVRDHYREDLKRVEVNLDKMVEMSVKVFGHYHQKNFALATAVMADTDVIYGELLSQIEDLRQYQRNLQRQYLEKQDLILLESQSGNYILVMLTLIMTAVLAFYGLQIFKLIRSGLEAELKNRNIIKALNTSSVVSITDDQGTIMDVNENFEKISGYSKNELIGKNNRVLKSNLHSEDFYKKFWNTLKNQESWIGDFTNRKKSGELYHLKTVITPLTELNGKTNQFLSINFDISEQKEIEHNLIEAQSIAKIGSWKYDFVTQKQIWSSEHYRIFEIEEPQKPEDLYRLYRERIHPDDLPTLDHLVFRAKEYGENFEFNHRVYLDQGKRIKNVKGIGKVVLDANSKPIYISGTCQDVTKIYETTEQLRSTLEFNKAILQSAKFSVITTDLNGLVTGFNLEAEKVLGYQASEVINQFMLTRFYEASEIESYSKQLSIENNQKIDPGFMTLIHNAKAGSYDERQWSFIGKNGRRVQVSLTLSGIYDSQGTLTGFMGIAKDLSHYLELQKSLETERAKSVHNAKLASLGEMSAGIAHEINNPLAIIISSLSLIDKSKSDPSKLSHRVETITKAAIRIEKIVNGLRKFARLPSGAEHKPESLNEILNESILLTQVKAKRHFVEVKTKIQEDLPIRCDSVEIEQVLVNLINNAIDAIKPLEDRWIQINAFSRDQQVIVQIIDSGSGISPEIEQKLFQPFFTTKEVGEGTGLGLSIAKGILDNHQAYFGLNREFKNTCFEIRFQKVNAEKMNGKYVA